MSFYGGFSASHATALVPIIAAATYANTIAQRFAAFYCAASADLLAMGMAVWWLDPPNRCFTPILHHTPRPKCGEDADPSLLG